MDRANLGIFNINIVTSFAHIYPYFGNLGIFWEPMKRNPFVSRVISAAEYGAHTHTCGQQQYN